MSKETDFIHLPNEITNLWLLIMQHIVYSDVGTYPLKYAEIALGSVEQDLDAILDHRWTVQSVDDMDDIAIREHDLRQVLHAVRTMRHDLDVREFVDEEGAINHIDGMLGPISKVLTTGCTFAEALEHRGE